MKLIATINFFPRLFIVVDSPRPFRETSSLVGSYTPVGYEGGDCPIPKTQSPYLLCLSKEKPMTDAEQVSRSVHYTLHLGHQ